MTLINDLLAEVNFFHPYQLHSKASGCQWVTGGSLAHQPVIKSFLMWVKANCCQSDSLSTAAAVKHFCISKNPAANDFRTVFFLNHNHQCYCPFPFMIFT